SRTCPENDSHPGIIIMVSSQSGRKACVYAYPFINYIARKCHVYSNGGHLKWLRMEFGGLGPVFPGLVQKTTVAPTAGIIMRSSPKWQKACVYAYPFRNYIPRKCHVCNWGHLKWLRMEFGGLDLVCKS
ncbi:hypothetical protein CEXT_802481, partial [Caerostris extrusa]